MPPADLCSGMDSASAARTVVSHLGAQVSRRVAARGIADRGLVGQVVHRERCSTWPTSPRPASKQARRRDGIPTPGRRPAASQHPACNRSGPRVPPRARSQGHRRSITVTSVHCYWISAGQHFAGQDHDPCPIFQAGHAVRFRSPASCIVTGKRLSHVAGHPVATPGGQLPLR